MAGRLAREQDVAKHRVKEQERWKSVKVRRECQQGTRWKLAVGHGVHYVPWSGDELLCFSPTALGSMSISGHWRDTKPHSAGNIRSNHIPLQSALSTDSAKTNT